MDVFKGARTVDKALKHAVVAIGNFDGVHRGHRAILGLAAEKARARGGVAIAYTFRPHPQQALHPGSETKLLTTYDEKLELLAQAGVVVTIEEPFSREFSTVPPTEFFNDILLRRLSAEAIVVGYDFAFGRERSGNLEELAKRCEEAGVELTVVPAQRFEGEVVSSSRIRQHLREGKLAEATRLLGREFFYCGTVVRGEGRGRTIGFPTANVKAPGYGDKLVLPYGVYATRAIVDGVTHASVTNLGVRPTFQVGSEELPVLVETHLLDFDADLYGRTIEVRFAAKLRDERRFAGIDALKAQIALDAEAARAALAPTS